VRCFSEIKRDEPEDGEVAVPDLGVGAHDAAAPGFSAVSRIGTTAVEHHDRRREPGELGPAPGLREEATV
jgi:hypothetical protein